MAQITRTSRLNVPVPLGGHALSLRVDEECARIERDGNRVVSVSHARHDATWSILIAYCKAEEPITARLAALEARLLG